MSNESRMVGVSGRRAKVLHVIGTLNRGGAETLLLEIARSSRSLPVDLSILCYGHASFDLEPAVSATGARVVRVSSGLSIREIWRLLRELRPDVVHAHTDLNAGVVTALAWARRISVRVVHAHRSSFRSDGAALKRRLYEVAMGASIHSLSTLRIACGQDAGEAMFGGLPFTIVRNGVDLERFRFRALARGRIRREFASADPVTEPALLGAIARLEPVKNHDLLLAIASELRDRGRSFRMLLVGRGSQERHLRERVAALELTDHVLFLGVRDDVDDLLNGLDAVLLPSLSEGFPVSAVEAQVNGVPILISDQVDPRAVLNPNALMVSIDGARAAGEWASILERVLDGALGRVEPTDLARTYDAAVLGAKIYALYAEQNPALGVQ